MSDLTSYVQQKCNDYEELAQWCYFLRRKLQYDDEDHSVLISVLSSCANQLEDECIRINTLYDILNHSDDDDSEDDDYESRNEDEIYDQIIEPSFVEQKVREAQQLIQNFSGNILFNPTILRRVLSILQRRQWVNQFSNNENTVENFDIE